MPQTAVIWNDSSAIIESAIQTALRGKPTSLRGVPLLYPSVLAALLLVRLPLDAIAIIQSALWCGIAITMFLVIRILPIERSRPGVSESVAGAAAAVLLAYPGLKIYTQIVYSEVLYAALVFAVCLTCHQAWRNASGRRLAWCAVALLLASMAALTKFQGLAVVCAAGLALCCMPQAKLPSRVFALTVAGACVVLVGLLASKSVPQSDVVARIFGAKTLFCVHLQRSSTAAGADPSSGPAVLQHLAGLQAHIDPSNGTHPVAFPTLGHDADACQFDTALDALVMQSQGSVEGVRRWYLKNFVRGVMDSPGDYVLKVLKQMLYGFKMSLPPHGVAAVPESVEERALLVQRLLAANGFERTSSFPSAAVGEVLGPDSSRAQVLAWRLVSIAGALALLACLARPLTQKRRLDAASALGFIAAVLWACHIGIVACTHTLDVWRYVAVGAPLVVICMAVGALKLLAWRFPANMPLRTDVVS